MLGMVALTGYFDEDNLSVLYTSKMTSGLGM